MRCGVSKRMLSIVICAFGVLLASEARAACTISTSSLSFGTYNVFNTAPVDSTGTITFKCGFLDFNISVGLSTGSSGTFNARTLRKGTEAIRYNLFRDAPRTIVWGDGTSGTQVYTNAWSFGQTINLTIYGRLNAEEDVSAGTYVDTISAVINF
jgi:spore coat protein U-like protein